VLTQGIRIYTVVITSVRIDSEAETVAGSLMRSDKTASLGLSERSGIVS